MADQFDCPVCGHPGCVACIVPTTPAPEPVEVPVAELAAAEAERDHLAALLWGLRLDLHPVAGSTSRRGGVGGQAMTEHCDVIHLREAWQERLLIAVDTALGVAIDRDRRDGTTRLADALTKAKEPGDEE